jgi:RNA polymerase primary sigma factor
VTTKQIETHARLPGEPVSFSSPIAGTEGDGASLGDAIAGDIEGGEALALRRERESEAVALLQSLPSRERGVLEKRFGFSYRPSDGETLQDVGQAIGVTRERVRQIESAALRTLRDRARRGKRDVRLGA